MYLLSVRLHGASVMQQCQGNRERQQLALQTEKKEQKLLQKSALLRAPSHRCLLRLHTVPVSVQGSRDTGCLNKVIMLIN